MTKLKIIIADDEQIIHDALKEALLKRFKEIEFQSFYAIPPLLQFLKLHHDEYDVLFLDNWFEGGLTGKTALPAIRLISPDLPIIFLTGDERYDNFAGIENYNIKFLNKPAREAEIYFAINGSIKTRESFSEMQTKLKKFQEEISSTRKWARDFLKLKDIDVELNDNDLTDDKKWAQYQAKVLNIVEKMKEEELQESGQQQFETIKKALMKKYSKFEENDINFCATGELLWQHYKDQIIDFSPILISYSKFLESVLKKLLVRHHIIQKSQESMLGNSIRELKYNSHCFGPYNSEKIRKLISHLYDFTEYRNKAAHPEGVSSTMLESAKNILFNDIAGERLSALELIHFYY